MQRDLNISLHYKPTEIAILKSQTIPPPSSYKLIGHHFIPLFELALIRLIPSYDRINAYFINLMLIAAFNGF